MEASVVRVSVAFLLIALAAGTLVAPLITFTLVGWKAKRKDIMDGLDAKACLCYFQMFSPSSNVATTPENAHKQFRLLYSEWYGRRFFLIPGLLLFAAGSAATTVVVFTGLQRLGYITSPFFLVPETALAAIAGAYLWILNDHISRTRRLDFSPADVYWSILRLIISVPMGYAFAALLAESLAPFVAFAAGAFPLTELLSLLRRSMEKTMGQVNTSDTSDDGIIKLQGVNKAVEERLAHEDVTTISQIAYCDPVHLVMRSNLTFNFVTDCMNQALAWLYFEDAMKLLRPLSIRGAIEVKNLIDECDEPEDSSERQNARQCLIKIAETLKQDPITLERTFREIAEDPYTQFLQEVWSYAARSEDREPA